MYNHPITSIHLSTIQTFGYTVIPPISKTLICGDTGILVVICCDWCVGIGAMVSISDIINTVSSHLTHTK